MIRLAAGRRGRPRAPDALTDAEAWAYLCDRADPSGEIHATVEQLAAAWCWHHSTVSRFVSPLRVSRGVLRICANEINLHKTAPRRAALRYHGGKWQLAPWIIEHFPPHRCYTEGFGGGGSVLLRKEPSRGEVYNDLDGEVNNVFRVLRSPADRARLKRALRATPFSRQEFVESWEPCSDPVEQARRTIVRSFLGFGSTAGVGGRTGFRSGMRGNSHSAAATWSNYPDALDAFGARLARVTIEGPRPALDVIRQYDGPDTLHYVDPPYPHATRSRSTVRDGGGYRYEMTDTDHRALATGLHALEGMVVLSGYACDLYDRELYPDWHRVTRETFADGALKRTEVLWINPAAWARLHGERTDLFLSPST